MIERLTNRNEQRIAVLCERLQGDGICLDKDIEQVCNIEEALRLIADIADGYDGCGNDVEDLKSLIDEMRELALKALSWERAVEYLTPEEFNERLKSHKVEIKK